MTPKEIFLTNSTPSAKTSELTVVTKMYNFTLWLIERIEKFPRSHRFTIGDRLETNALETLETLVEAGYSRDKGALLRKANQRIERMRLLLRLSKDLRLVSISQYEFSIKALFEIGSETGGWLKSLTSAASIS